MTSKEKKIKQFDPNSPGDTNNGMYGLPFTTDDAEVVIIPVPWEVTVSYGSGTAKGPLAVYKASYQIDLYDPYVKDAWKVGIAMDEYPKAIRKQSDKLRKQTEKYIALLEQGETPATNEKMAAVKQLVNEEGNKLSKYVKQKSLHFIDKGKVVGLLGGDHSTPLGLMQAVAEKQKSFAVLQIDAHADLRDAYEGFEFSHASIMFNALKIKEVKKLVQVGIRDYCEAEVKIVKNSKGRIVTFYDRDIKQQQYKGKTWDAICNDIIKQLPSIVYISFDIDGLDPKLCPNTGTPVAGGFELEQAVYLIQKVVEAGKKIIAFDINEVSPGKDEWDANVGARLLYKIAILAAKSNGKANP